MCGPACCVVCRFDGANGDVGLCILATILRGSAAPDVSAPHGNLGTDALSHSFPEVDSNKRVWLLSACVMAGVGGALGPCDGGARPRRRRPNLLRRVRAILGRRRCAPNHRTTQRLTCRSVWCVLTVVWVWQGVAWTVWRSGISWRGVDKP